MSDAEDQQARAEFYLCLARAFLTPDSDAAWVGLREALADDLEELGGLLGYDLTQPLSDYRTAMAAIADQPTLLQVYSGLFLAPPRKVCLNAGSYLDGSLNGGSVVAMEAAYRRAGLERNEDFKDLADHVSIQLEYISFCLQTHPESNDAGHFLAHYVARWLPPFINDIEQAAAAPNPYLHVARVLSAAVAVDARTAPSTLSEAQSRHQTAMDKARHARAVTGVTDEGMAFIARRLSEKGLSIDHLAIPVDQRDEVQGLSKRVPPSPRRGSRLG